MSQQPSLTASPTPFLMSMGQEGLDKKRAQAPHAAGHYGPQALSFFEDTAVLAAKPSQQALVPQRGASQET